MLEAGLIIGAIAVLLFAGVVAFGAPFLPTLSSRVEDALDLLDLKSGQTMLELGCGDGRMQVAAAKRGIKSYGYEMNPLLVIYAKIRCFKYRGLATIKLANYWTADWPKADGIYVFLLQPYMEKLDKKLIHFAKGGKLKLVSFAFFIPDKKPKKEIKGMFLYEY